MAVSGGSYGGYMTAWIISQTDRFKAAVDGYGMTNIGAFIRGSEIPARFENYLGHDPAHYPSHSPIEFGRNIRTPTLIYHGELDPRVPVTQSRELYTQLNE